MNFKNFETKLRHQRQVKPKVPCNSLQTKFIFSKMDNIFNLPFRILEKDAAGMQFEPKRPAKVSNLLHKIQILPSKGSLISITAQSKDSLRRGMEAPSPEASGDFKGHILLSNLV